MGVIHHALGLAFALGRDESRPYEPICLMIEN